MAAQAWRVLELTPDLRHAVEAAAKAAGLEPEAWLARAIRKAALRPGALPELPSALEPGVAASQDPGARSLSTLLEQAFDSGRSRVAETIPYTEPPPPVPEPPPLVSGTAGDTYIARLPALYMPPPPPRRRTLALIMLIALVVAGGAGAGFFYLRYGDLAPAVVPALIAALPPTGTAAPSEPAARPVAEVPPPVEAAAAPAAAEAPASTSVEDFALGIRNAFGNGVPQDYGKAAEFFQKAASQGLPDAQYNLGALYERGLGVPKDPVRAVAWYRFAAKQGHAAAELSLGLAYANGAGVAQDYGEAARWFREAAGQGVVTAQYDLGALYADGRGVTRSAIEAYALFSMAADAGDSDARHQMLRLAQQMTPKDLRTARTRSAELAQSMVHLEGADSAEKASPAKP